MQADLSGTGGEQERHCSRLRLDDHAVPAASEPLKRASDAMSGAQQESFIQNNAPVLAALQNGRPDVADKLLRDLAALEAPAGLRIRRNRMRPSAEVAKINP